MVSPFGAAGWSSWARDLSAIPITFAAIGLGGIRDMPQIHRSNGEPDHRQLPEHDERSRARSPRSFLRPGRFVASAEDGNASPCAVGAIAHARFIGGHYNIECGAEPGEALASLRAQTLNRQAADGPRVLSPDVTQGDDTSNIGAAQMKGWTR